MANFNEKKSLASPCIAWYPGHMAKTKREIREKINLIDIIYEVIDARMPISSKIKDIDDLIKDKPRILIMTKYDLCDKKETDKFISYYESLGYIVVPVDLANNKNVKKVLELSESVSKELNEKRKSKGLKPRNLRALIIGIPNVGKSTLINRLVGKKAAGVGNKPGFTKSLSWIRINKDIDLLDSPGILWPKLEDQYEARILAIIKLYKEKLESRYNIKGDNMTNIEIMEEIAKKRGCVTKGNITDYERVSSIILNDIKNNAFKEITLDRLEKD